MTQDQIIVFAILAVTFVLFIWGRWRYDLVAGIALSLSVATGVVPAERAFSGFGDPVVITVACILVVSVALSRSGVIDYLLKRMSSLLTRPYLQTFLLALMVIILSGFINNIGALAVFMPVAMSLARKAGRPPSEILMPLSFASLLGGLITLIGTPPNLLISRVREEYVGAPFDMFDFSPVGIGICAIGLVYLTFGWRLIPGDRKGTPLPEEKFLIEDYITEVTVVTGSSFADKTIREAEGDFDGEFDITGLVRNGTHIVAPAGSRKIRESDILIIKAEPTVIKKLVDSGRVVLTGNEDKKAVPLSSDDFGVMEAIVMAESELVGMTVKQLNIRQRFGLNLLAVRQNGRKFPAQLKNVRFKAGDVIVLQGAPGIISETIQELNCLPLAERKLLLGRPRYMLLPVAIMTAAILLTAFNIIPVSTAFAGAVMVIALTGILRLDEIYEAIHWPIIVLLGALLPVTEALQATGGHEVIAGILVPFASQLPSWGPLCVVMIASMAVTPFLNNAAAVLVMAPVAVSLALKLGMNPDPFLMAVAVGTSCDFLTPIGHQSNTLVLGPGGYKFSDYFRFGLPLTFLVVIAGVPLITYFWPL